MPAEALAEQLEQDEDSSSLSPPDQGAEETVSPDESASLQAEPAAEPETNYRELYEQERQRRIDTQADWQRQQHELGLRRAANEELDRALAERAAADERASKQEFTLPEVADADELLVDPARLTGYMGDTVRSSIEYARRQILTELAPVLQAVGYIDSVLPTVLRDHQQGAWERAKAIVGEEQAGADADLDGYREKIHAIFQRVPQGAKHYLNPQSIADAYWMAKRAERGAKPVRNPSQPSASNAPSRSPSAAPASAPRNGKRVQVSPEMARALPGMAARLGVSKEKILARHMKEIGAS